MALARGLWTWAHYGAVIMFVAGGAAALLHLADIRQPTHVSTLPLVLVGAIVFLVDSALGSARATRSLAFVLVTLASMAVLVRQELVSPTMPGWASHFYVLALLVCWGYCVIYWLTEQSLLLRQHRRRGLPAPTAGAKAHSAAQADASPTGDASRPGEGG